MNHLLSNLSFIITILVLITSTYTDIKYLRIPKIITYPYFIFGLIYRFVYPTQLAFHLLILPLFFIFLYKQFLAPGDIKLLLGFSLWNTFATTIWMILFTLILLGIVEFINKCEQEQEHVKIPVAPLFLMAFVVVIIFYNLFPVASFIYS